MWGRTVAAPPHTLPPYQPPTLVMVQQPLPLPTYSNPGFIQPPSYMSMPSPAPIWWDPYAGPSSYQREFPVLPSLETTNTTNSTTEVNGYHHHHQHQYNHHHQSPPFRKRKWQQVVPATTADDVVQEDTSNIVSNNTSNNNNNDNNNRSENRFIRTSINKHQRFSIIKSAHNCA